MNILLPMALMFWNMGVVIVLCAQYRITSKADRAMLLVPILAFYLLCWFFIRKANS